MEHGRKAPAEVQQPVETEGLLMGRRSERRNRRRCSRWASRCAGVLLSQPGDDLGARVMAIAEECRRSPQDGRPPAARPRERRGGCGEIMPSPRAPAPLRAPNGPRACPCPERPPSRRPRPRRGAPGREAGIGDAGGERQVGAECPADPSTGRSSPASTTPCEGGMRHGFWRRYRARGAVEEVAPASGAPPRCPSRCRSRP